MVPDDGGIVPVIQLNSVVLPAPLGPIRQMISPSFMHMETLLSAARPPKSLVTFMISNKDMLISRQKLVTLGIDNFFRFIEPSQPQAVLPAPHLYIGSIVGPLML